MSGHIASWIWVFIPITAILIVPFKMWLRMKERQLNQQSTLTAEKSAQYAAHTERLEQRVRVLERIITDKGMEVSDQIEALRDDSRRDRPGQETSRLDKPLN